MKHTETAFRIKSLHSEQYLVFSPQQGARWTSNAQAAIGFLEIDRAINFALSNGIRSKDFHAVYETIDVEPDQAFNRTVQKISIAKAKVFRGDGRIEEI